jgi:ferric-dicitrate binding protein FerR (iron transport regulator)
MNIAKDERLEQAARWLVRSQDKDFTPEDKRRMHAWLNEAPANREAFEEMRKAWEHIGVLTPVLAPISIHPYKAKKYAGVKTTLTRERSVSIPISLML